MAEMVPRLTPHDHMPKVTGLVCDLQHRLEGMTAVAETEGFEPSVRESPVRRFSKPLVSATHPRLRDYCAQALPGEGVERGDRAGGYIGQF